jgi:hypothetical protein
MTTIVEAATAIAARFGANFSAAPIAYENEPPTQRVDPHVRLSVQAGEPTPSLDSGYERTRGVVFIQCLVPKGKGDLLAWNIAEQAAAVFRYATFDGVRMTSASFTNVGILGDALEQDAGWHQVNVSVPFWIERFY